MSDLLVRAVRDERTERPPVRLMRQAGRYIPLLPWKLFEPDGLLMFSDILTVIDLRTFVTGGFCSLMLANQGADVIKIERLDIGDDNRHSGPPFVGDELSLQLTTNHIFGIWGLRTMSANI